MDSPYLRFTAGLDDTGKRLDKVVRRLLPGMPLSGIYAILRRGRVRVNGLKAASERRIADGDAITIRIGAQGAASSLKPAKADQPSIDPGYHDIPLSETLLIENQDILIINKPAGALVHGPGGLDQEVRRYAEPRIPPSLSFRPGPCHRLDRNTSGVLVFSKSVRGARAASEAFASSSTLKIYLAVLDGKLSAPEHWIDDLKRLSNEGRTIRSETGGKRAETFVFPVAHTSGHSLALVLIGSGRTHQIRAQASERGYPLSGDAKYGGSRGIKGYILHCLEIRFTGADQGILPASAMAPLPPNATDTLAFLFGSEFMDAVEERRLGLSPIERPLSP